MQAAGRRTMPRPAVGVRPSTSCYDPAVPRSLRRARLLHSRRAPQGGPIGLSHSRRAARFAVVSRGVRRARLLHSRRAPQDGPIGLSRSRRAARFSVVPRGGGGFAFAVPDVRRRVGRSDFRAPAVPRSLRLCGGGFGGARLCCSRCAPQGGSIGLSRSRRTARFAAGAPSTFATCAVRALVFHSLRQIFSRCPH